MEGRIQGSVGRIQHDLKQAEHRSREGEVHCMIPKTLPAQFSVLTHRRHSMGYSVSLVPEYSADLVHITCGNG